MAAAIILTSGKSGLMNTGDLTINRMDNLEFEAMIRRRSLACYKRECERARRVGRWKREAFRSQEAEIDINIINIKK